MRYLLLFMLLVGVFVVGKRSCHIDGFGIKGSGPIKTESRAVNGFHAVSLDIAATVELRVGDYNVEVQAQENLLPILKTELQDGALRIYFEDDVSHSEGTKVVLTAPSFDAISLGGSGEIRASGPLQADKMDLSIGGSGNIVIPQSSFNSLNCAIGGSGAIELGGKANTMQVDLGGSGQIEAKDMEVNELNAQISGSGSVTAHVLQVLKADISGSGEINYSGDPKVESNISGSGSVSKI